jgi:acyl carrier protein
MEPRTDRRLLETRVRALLGKMDIASDERSLRMDDDLYDAGMTSHASVRLMLSLEDAFDIEFPDEMLQREVFASVGAIVQAVSALTLGAGRQASDAP